MYKKQAIKVAKMIGYDERVIKQLEEAKNDAQVVNIMLAARRMKDKKKRGKRA